MNDPKSIEKQEIIPVPTRPLIHPVSALVLLLFDYLFFSLEVPLVSLPLACFLAFVLTFTSITIVQRKLCADCRRDAVLKATLCAILAAIPTPIAGTAAGALILSMAGIRQVRHSDKSQPHT